MLITDYVFLTFRKTPFVLYFFDLLGDILVYGSVIAFYLFWIYFGFKNKKFNWFLFIEVTLALFITFSYTSYLKTFYPSPRPLTYYFPEFELFDSFPSRQTMVITVLAFLIFYNHLQVGIPLIALSLLTGFLRWLSLSHWPIDVFVGWMSGFLLAILILELSKFMLRLKKK